MVYIESWDEFAEKAEMLFRAEPLRTRYCVKYRHREGLLVLKVTDDKVCLKFKTDQAQDAKKMEKLNTLFFTLMTKGENAPAPEDVVMPDVQQAPPSKKGRGRK
ncbi:Signal recognition particle SRP9/SRP14 subunit [Klebsormidium nitens]|uniref:Signal recognition particle 9 kDa protein n=1 Tax=Klebsormidium nitens TaxID=105231 RepID=A0A1Y1I374_KLENI|nr:Signal recognition particle SRP9/SRP14 subunit [Klebsormidium nitens]|eukprot:GAQ85385.1 Signal recognition particle SRP9/SRP14 subunit [Klebsormidium nitens]